MFSRRKASNRLCLLGGGWAAGFTLIELLIVIAIIAILAGIAVPQYNDYVRRAAVQEAFTTLSDLRVRLEQFYQDHRAYGTVGEAIPYGHDGTANRVDFAAGASRFAYACVLSGAGASQNQAFVLTATGASGAAVGHVYTLNQSAGRGTTTFKGGGISKSCWLVSGGEC